MKCLIRAMIIILFLASACLAAFYKNAADQKVFVFAYDKTTGAGKAGDANNITAQISTGGVGTATNDTNPTEIDDTNLPGVYAFDLTQGETNHNQFVLYAKSSTENIFINPVVIITQASIDQTGDNYTELTDANYGLAAAKTASDANHSTTQNAIDVAKVASDANFATAKIERDANDAMLYNIIKSGGTGDANAIWSVIKVVLTDTSELQTDWVNGGRLDLILDAVVEDSNKLQQDWADGGRLDLLLDTAVADANSADANTTVIISKLTDVNYGLAAAETDRDGYATTLTSYTDPNRFEESPALALLTADKTQEVLDANSVKLAGIDANIALLISDANRTEGKIDGGLIVLADVSADTNELQADWANGGRLDLILDAVYADTNDIQEDWAWMINIINSIDVNIAEIEADVNRVEGKVDDTLADTNEIQQTHCYQF